MIQIGGKILELKVVLEDIGGSTGMQISVVSTMEYRKFAVSLKDHAAAFIAAYVKIYEGPMKQGPKG